MITRPYRGFAPIIQKCKLLIISKGFLCSQKRINGSVFSVFFFFLSGVEIAIKTKIAINGCSEKSAFLKRQ